MMFMLGGLRGRLFWFLRVRREQLWLFRRMRLFFGAVGRRGSAVRIRRKITGECQVVLRNGHNRSLQSI